VHGRMKGIQMEQLLDGSLKRTMPETNSKGIIKNCKINVMEH